ncbi:MAG: 50S ribosomal protein L23 [Coriobacteriales bacterium]|jgi:large subunit ribosomal protein L23|nr:50S ribosomal protein L23 [Coriobacteriales bacterium]
MKDPRQVIIRPIISERAYDLINDNRYTFEVAKKANKIEIRDAVESIFDVHVLGVNTMSVKGKPRRVRYAKGYTRSWKKAIVTLVAGETIEAFGV